MTEVYYCRNEEDMKRVAIHIFSNPNYELDESIDKSHLYSCDYKPEDIECCEECELEFCLLHNHLSDKNVHKHIEVYQDIDYPCIVCVTDSDLRDESVTICSVTEAKDNTKYGCGYGW